ncbi:MAG: ribbon-helix-helix protein, CopG family [Patulibacter sp.]|nr:ribbon-helix-helix protein, CopG family [Patulibacter sp.]
MQRITITVPDDVLADVKSVVDRGGAPSVSAFFAAAARDAIPGDSLEKLAADMEAEFGPVPPEIQEWADRILAGEIDE